VLVAEVRPADAGDEQGLVAQGAEQREGPVEQPEVLVDQSGTP